jgi:hypothetical protein
MAIRAALQIQGFAARHQVRIGRGLGPHQFLLRVVFGQGRHVRRRDFAMDAHFGRAFALAEGFHHGGQQGFGLPVEMRNVGLGADAIAAVAFATIAGKVRIGCCLGVDRRGTEQDGCGQ